MTTIDRVFSRFEREHEQGWYGRLGVLQLHLSGPPDHHLYAIFGAQGVALIEGVHPDPAAALTLPARLFLLLMERAEFLDLRTLLYLRGVELRGDRTLIYQALCGLARPSEVTIAHLEESEERSARARVATIPRYACGSRDGVIAAVRGGAPAVVSGAMADWEGLRLQPTYLRRELGDILLRSAAGALPLRDFLQVMFEDDAPIYTWGADLPADLRPLDPPADLATLPPQIWMGSANIRHGALDPSTSLHRDLATSLLCQIFGHKLIILYSPDQSPCLYPSRNFAFHQPCFAEPLGCDEKRFPRLREARPLLTLLMPGEILVIPRHWFHTVYAMSPTLSVSYLVADDGPFTRALAEVFRATGARDYGELLPALHDNIPAELWIEREGPTMVRAAGGR